MDKYSGRIFSEIAEKLWKDMYPLMIIGKVFPF